jgi:uncharacterized protein YidB (DUF937 family)
LNALAGPVLEHAILLNLTGIVGGVEEAMARAPEMSALGPLVQAMANPGPAEAAAEQG